MRPTADLLSSKAFSVSSSQKHKTVNGYLHAPEQPGSQGCLFAPVEKFSGRKSEGRAHDCYLQDLQQSLTPAAPLHWTVSCILVQKWTLDAAVAQRYALCV